MKPTQRFAAVTAAAAASILLSAGGALAQNDEGLLSPLLGNVSLLQVCYPMGQVGHGNTFAGTQNINCNQNAEVTAPAANGGNGTGVTGAERVSESAVVEPGQFGSAVALCPEGKVVTGGGFSAFPEGFQIQSADPLPTVSTEAPIAYSVSGTNQGTQPVTLTAHAVCVNGVRA
ncbi:hypothetical protein [Streptomyces roseoviridis]|uniref:Secreted protein n=1 Tax=Streptomyces roseoviridis TaxID=67361 RepID=A0ABV5R0A2_9ACTN